MVRWFKNERLGFSVTYYEGNRPRQYHPDFLVTAREGDGREVLWVIETKGEIRPNTKLKSEAAELWCQRMSTTRYGSWRYLFVQQKRFETALASGVRSLAEFAAAIVHPRPEPQLKIFSFEEARRKRQAFKTMLPLYGLRAAAGYFGDGEAVEPKGAALLRRRLFRLFIGVFCSRTITFRFVLRGDSAPDSAHPPLSGLQPGLITAPGRFGRPLRPPGHSRGVLVRCIGKGDASAMAVAATTRFSGRAFWVALGAASDQGRMDRHCRRAGEAPNTVRRLRES